MERPLEPRNAPRPRGRAALAFLPLALLAACSGPAVPPKDYALRGVVRQLPDPKDPATALYLHHEAVAGFVDRDGKATEMESMTMPFDLAEGVSLAGVAVGDPVQATLHVDWSAARPARITQLAELPPGTRIELGAARP